MGPFAIVDLGNTYGAALVGLFVSSVCVCLISFLVGPLLSWRIPSLLGVTLIQA
jgi:hypothetical protein